MDVSFIVPSYQQGRFIRQCLDSIRDQGLPAGSFEVLVIDGGSTDETAEVVRSHPLKPYFLSEPDRGQAHAVNKGIAKAQGEYLAWINSDDFYRPGVFPELLAIIRSDQDHKVFYGEGDIVDEQGGLLGAYPTEDWNPRRLMEKCFLCQPSVVFHREVVETVGPLDEDCHLVLDLEFWMRAGKRYAFRRLPCTIACSRHYEGTKSRQFPLRMQAEALLAGHQHFGAWSSRRMWSVAENRLLLRFPGLACALKKDGAHYLKFAALWIMKTWLYLDMRVRPGLEQRLIHWLKALPGGCS